MHDQLDKKLDQWCRELSAQILRLRDLPQLQARTQILAEAAKLLFLAESMS